MALAQDTWWTQGSLNLFELCQRSLLAIAAVAIVSVAAFAQYQRRKYPPGPSRLSAFLGTILFNKNLLDYKKSWKQRFGRIYTLFVGRMRVVMMTDYDMINDAFVRQADACSSRPSAAGGAVKSLKAKGFTSPDWKEQKKFAVAVLREQGMGKVDIEHKIREEITPFLNDIEKHCGSPLNPGAYIHRAISNVICNLVLGSRFDYSDPAFASFLERSLKLNDLEPKMRAINMIPLLKWLPGVIFGTRSYVTEAQATCDYFLKAIHQHEQTLDPDSPRDFIDAYLIEMRARARSGVPASFDHANCVAMVAVLFVAGTDTTANTLLWAWLFMMLHPEIQKQVQNEIDRIIGSRMPSLNDRASLPLTEAVLTEVLRLGNTAPSSTLHLIDADVNVGGYVVPKGAMLQGSLSDVHLDENTYPNPTQFNPQRFLSSSGAFEKPKKFIPFSIGRRACPGESLARAELFLFFTSVLQHFNLSAPEGSAFRAEGKTGLSHKPLPYQIIFQRRP